MEALAPAAAANPPTEARSAAQAYPGQGVEGAAAAAASAAVDELASAAPRARNKGNPPTTESSGTGLLLEVECRSGIQAEWIGLGCKPSVKAAAILSHCRDRTGMQELDTLSIWPDGSTLDLRVAIGDSLRAGETKLLATGPVGSGTAASSSHGDLQPAGGIQATQGKGSPPPQVLAAAFDAVQREAPEVVNPFSAWPSAGDHGGRSHVPGVWHLHCHRGAHAGSLHDQSARRSGPPLPGALKKAILSQKG